MCTIAPRLKCRWARMSTCQVGKTIEAVPTNTNNTHRYHQNSETKNKNKNNNNNNEHKMHPSPR